MRSLLSFVLAVTILLVFDRIIIPNVENNRQIILDIKENQTEFSETLSDKDNQIACLQHSLQCALREDTTFPCIALHGDTLIGNFLVENPLSCDNYE